MKLQDLTQVILVAAIGLYGCGKKDGGGGGGGGGDTEVETEEDNGNTGGATLDPIDWGKVDFTFVSPKDTEDLQPGNVTIEIDTNLGTQGTWSLYYTTSFNSIDNATPIKEGMQPTETSLVWDTSTLEPSTYFLFASLHFGSQTNVRFFQGAITVEDPDGDNRTPFISILTDFTESNNNNPSVLLQGADRVVQWRMIEPDGEDVTVQIQLSPDEGGTWEDLDLASAIEPVPDVENEYRVTWTIAGNQPISSRYRFRIVAKDTAGKEGIAVTNAFGISDVGPVTFRNAIQQILSDNCLSCHDQAGVAADANSNNLRVDYVDTPISGGGEGARNYRDRIEDRVTREIGAAGFMPQTGSLDEAEKSKIQMWIWNNGSQGSNPPDILATNFTGARLLLDEVYTLTWTVEDLVRDGTQGSAEMTVYIEENGGSFAAIDVSGATTSANATDGNDLDYSFDYTPTGLTPGVARLRLDADNGVGRARRATTDANTNPVRVLRIFDPTAGGELKNLADATSDCTTASAVIPTRAQLEEFFPQLSARHGGALDTVWTADEVDADNQETINLDAADVGTAPGSDLKTNTHHVLCIQGDA